MCEESGINTTILRIDNDTHRIIKRYWNEWGGQIQWIAQAKAEVDDLTSDISKAIDRGAKAIFIHGGVGDEFVKEGHVDLLAKCVEFIKQNGLPGGLAAHDINTVKACEKAGIENDFYMKTINSKSYWSAGPMPRKRQRLGGNTRRNH